MGSEYSLVKRFSRCESGGTVVEYALLMALMALALIGALAATGGSTTDKWDGVSDDIGDAMTKAGI